jgi:diguanylate cyclase (GGDEF)-like protein
MQLLQSIVRITGRKDLPGLGKTLVEELQRLLGDAIALFNWINGEQGPYLRCQAHSSNYQESPDAMTALQQCLETHQIVHFKGCTVFPLIEHDQVTWALCIHNAHIKPQQEEIIHAFMRVFRNYLEIIHDSEHDHLTGLSNQRQFNRRMAEILSSERNRRRSDRATSFVLAVLDIDHFKQVNDTLGHIFGDSVLMALAAKIRDHFREDDLLFRYGGEEFAILLCNIDEETALGILERFRARIADTPISGGISISVSIGITGISPERQQRPERVVEEADMALYYAKEHGRNAVFGYSRLVEDGRITALA